MAPPQVPLDNVDLSRMSLLYTQGEMAAVTPIYDYDFAVRTTCSVEMVSKSAFSKRLGRSMMFESQFAHHKAPSHELRSCGTDEVEGECFVWSVCLSS